MGKDKKAKHTTLIDEDDIQDKNISGERDSELEGGAEAMASSRKRKRKRRTGYFQAFHRMSPTTGRNFVVLAVGQAHSYAVTGVRLHITCNALGLRLCPESQIPGFVRTVN